MAGTEIERLIQLLAKLPGLGPRSARRAALAMLKKRETLMNPLAEAIERLKPLDLAAKALQPLLESPELWQSAAAWHHHLDGPPRIAEDLFSWERPGE